MDENSWGQFERDRFPPPGGRTDWQKAITKRMGKRFSKGKKAVKKRKRTSESKGNLGNKAPKYLESRLKALDEEFSYKNNQIDEDQSLGKGQADKDRVKLLTWKM